ncbi:hypothetical protein ACQP2F_21785 [Actinoplanes sp. CA-030573]|uniref:hypothetical protein n=1 Tax=Actinoplanes sp. CA-030573 TaxID=3239898 RepID=UPI003D8BB2D5
MAQPLFWQLTDDDRQVNLTATARPDGYAVRVVVCAEPDGRVVAQLTGRVPELKHIGGIGRVFLKPPASRSGAPADRARKTGAPTAAPRRAREAATASPRGARESATASPPAGAAATCGTGRQRLTAGGVRPAGRPGGPAPAA